MIFAKILLFKCFLVLPSFHFDCTIKIMPNVFPRRRSHDFHLLPRHNPLWHLFFFFFALLCPDIYSNYVLDFCFSMSVFYSFLWSDIDLQERCLISLLSTSLLYCTSKTCTRLFKRPSWVPVQTELTNISVCVAWHYRFIILCVQYAWDRNRYTLLSHQSWLT